MELDKIFGLPAHPLLVHLPVIMVPLAAVVAVALVIRPTWLARFGWVLVGLTGVGMIGAILAAGSGEALQERVRETEVLERHMELGETARLVAVLFFLVAVVVVGAHMWSVRKGDSPDKVSTLVRKRSVATALAVVLVATGAGAFYTMADAGHQGARATWDEVASRDSGSPEHGNGDRPDTGKDHDDDD
jgi:uncharacterized membrane protein